MQVNLFCNLFLSGTTFSENDGVGVGGSNSPYGLFYASERLALPWDKTIGKRQYHLFQSGISADRLDELLVYCRTLYDVNGTPAFHHIRNLQRIKVIHYCNHGKLVSLSLLPVN